MFALRCVAARTILESRPVWLGPFVRLFCVPTLRERCELRVTLSCTVRCVALDFTEFRHLHFLCAALFVTLRKYCVLLHLLFLFFNSPA